MLGSDRRRLIAHQLPQFGRQSLLHLRVIGHGHYRPLSRIGSGIHASCYQINPHHRPLSFCQRLTFQVHHREERLRSVILKLWCLQGRILRGVEYLSSNGGQVVPSSIHFPHAASAEVQPEGQLLEHHATGRAEDSVRCDHEAAVGRVSSLIRPTEDSCPLTR